MRRWLEGGGAEAKKSTQRVRQSVNSEFTIPGEVVGRVIGRHGMHVRQLEEQSGARIKFKDQQDSKDKVLHRAVSAHWPAMYGCTQLCLIPAVIPGGGGGGQPQWCWVVKSGSGLAHETR